MERRHDAVASLTVAVGAAVAVVASIFLPWWVLEARAPQYGQRVLLVEVGPAALRGDLFELDTLGHYVGIAPVKSMATLERAVGTPGLALAALGVLCAPWLRRRWQRLLAVLPVILLPFVFVADLAYWTDRSMNRRDPDAALSIPSADPQLVGEYKVGQFKMKGEIGGGMFLAALAGLLGAGLAFAAPLPTTGWRRARAIAPAILGGLVLQAGVARAGTVTVPPEEPISGAIARAAAGDRIVVLPGIHHEHLVVDRRVEIVGRPGAVIDGGGRGTIVHITAPGARLVGLDLRGSGDNYTAEDAGIRIQAPDVRIEDTRLEDVLFGIFALEAHRCQVVRVAITGKPLPVTRRGDGIRLWSSHGCRVEDSLIRDSRDLVIWYSNDTVVAGNLVTRSRYGLHYMYSDRNLFRGNRFQGNEVGAAVMYSRDVVLDGNEFSASHGPSAYGLLLKDADDIVITGNRFVDNDLGLFFDGAPQSAGARVDVRGNLIAGNEGGVALQPASRGARFWDNTFVANRRQVQVQGEGSANQNQWAVGGRGNYWSDAVVYDRDGDGVSEVPYRVESTYEALADRHPVLSFFAGTPGAEAIDAAARSFPIFAPRPRLVDPRPLASPTVAATRAPGASASLVGAGGVLLTVAIAAFVAARKGPAS